MACMNRRRVYRDGVKSERIFIAPTFGWELSSRTTLRLEGEYLYDKSPIDRGLVAIGNGVAPIPVSRFLGDPTRKNETQNGKATLTLWHEINDMFKWRSAFRASVTTARYSSLESNFLVGEESARILNLARYEIPTTVQKATISRTNYTVYFRRVRSNTKQFWASNWDERFHRQRPPVISVAIPLHQERLATSISSIPTTSCFSNPSLTKFSDASQTNNILGAYFGDQVDLLENLHMHFGGRFDLFDQTINNNPDRFHPHKQSEHANQYRIQSIDRIGLSAMEADRTLRQLHGVIRTSKLRIQKYRRKAVQP